VQVGVGAWTKILKILWIITVNFDDMAIRILSIEYYLSDQFVF